MKVKVYASTKTGHTLPREEVKVISGKAAGVCYMKDTFETLDQEPFTKSTKRAEMTLTSWHHSVWEHATYTLVLEDVPKILAMLLNNEGLYNTSEKSARYTEMKTEGLEKELYEKWISLFAKKIQEVYPTMSETETVKKAQENARYLISVFTPATTMVYTVSYRKLNDICHAFERIEPYTIFMRKVQEVALDFVEKIKALDLYEPNLDCHYELSLWDNRQFHAEHFSETYSTTYYGTFSQLAQAQRHRKIRYCMLDPDVDGTSCYYAPPIIRADVDLLDEWWSDMISLGENYPQGLKVRINERGTYEQFAYKCKERLCGAAQLEIMQQTKETLATYLKKTKEKDVETYEYLEQYAQGTKVTMPSGFCSRPCFFTCKKAFKRLV